MGRHEDASAAAGATGRRWPVVYERRWTGTVRTQTGRGATRDTDKSAPPSGRSVWGEVIEDVLGGIWTALWRRGA